MSFRSPAGRVLVAMLLAGGAPLHAAHASPASSDASASAALPRPGQQLMLNFPSTDIEALSRAIGSMLDRPIFVDPRVKGSMTLFSERPVSVAEAYASFVAALRGLGYAVVESAGLLKIVPEGEAKVQAGTVSVDAPSPRSEQVVTQVFRLNHENIANLVPVLRPLISPNNTINANAGTNTLVITDYADNIQRLARLIAALDVPAWTDIEVIPLKHTVAADLSAMVQRLADGSAAGAPANAGAANGISVVADTADNALIVRAQNAARLNIVRGIVDKLDQPRTLGGTGGGVHVVTLRNADAAKLATVLRASFGNGAGSSTGSSGSPGASASPLSPAATPASSSSGSTSSSSTSSASTAPVGASPSPSTGGFIQADPSTNALVITAPEPLYREVRAIIDQLDARRNQVYVEALIVEVDADKAAELSVQWQGIGSAGGSTLVGLGTNFGSGNTNILGASQTLAQGSTGLVAADASAVNGINFAVARKVGGIYTLGVLARALESNSGVNILSTPNLVTLDNEEAKIVVGQNVPFVTGSYTSTSSSTTSPFQTIERKDVGLTLRIRPQIGDGDAVRMTIFQESSSVLSTTAAGTTNAGPSTAKRSIESTVVVDDGDTLVLGGLIEDNITDTHSKVPLLGDLPYVGVLFRTDSRTHKKTNLMVFLRPVVMRSREDANRLSAGRYDTMRGLQGAMPAVPGSYEAAPGH
jgi:general secretion pathway protein D